MIVADTSGLLAFFNSAEPQHQAVAEVVAAEADPLVISPYVVAELDYLVSTRVGVEAELAVLGELGGGGYHLVSFDASELLRALVVIDRYRDQEIGLADASLVVLAERFATRTLLTLDRRHFEVVRPFNGGRFRLLPSRDG